MTRSAVIGAVLVLGSLAALNACDKKTPPPSTSTPSRTTTPAPATPSTAPSPATPAKHDDHDHADAHGHEGHDHADGGHEGHGPVVALGTAPVGAFQVKASRDGDITAGGEAPVDLWVTPSAGSKIAAVRAWIGTQDAAGSVKAKLDLEKDNYHSHVEVPTPLPAASKLWVEIEDDKGAKVVGSFDLKS